MANRDSHPRAMGLARAGRRHHRGGGREGSQPDPAGIIALLERWHLRSEHALYVGDHRVDALAANAAGVPFVGVLTGATTRAQFAELGVRDVLSSVAELPAHLRARY